MIAAAIGLFVLAVWLGLAATGFWRTDQRDGRVPAEPPLPWPEVVAVVPARNEADVIARSIASLTAQDYPGRFRIILVDDDSDDNTADIARAVDSERLEILAGRTLPAGWTGKLWALSQGIAAAGTPDYLWLADADIAHAPDTLRSLVGIARAGDRVLVSFMARLHCRTFHERALIPAFVWFFQMLYPFARVNRPGRTAGAAGGCVLVRRRELAAAGGIGAIRGALIDDCTLARLMKRRGPIWLGLTDRSRSIRPYDSATAIGAMIARSAYAQLGYSPLQLIGTILGLVLVYLGPPILAMFGQGVARWSGLAAWVLMAALYLPMLRFYRCTFLWGIAVPAIAAFYGGCTLFSAWQYARGRGGLWKGRVQATVGR